MPVHTLQMRYYTIFAMLLKLPTYLQLDVEEVYVLAVLEADEDRRNDLLKRYTEIAVDNSFHLQPG